MGCASSHVFAGDVDLCALTWCNLHARSYAGESNGTNAFKNSMEERRWRRPSTPDRTAKLSSRRQTPSGQPF